MFRIKRVVVVLTVVAAALAFVQKPQVLSGQATTAKSAAPQAKTPAGMKPATTADVSSMPLVSIAIVQVKPELLTEWQDFQKNEVNSTLQKGGVKQRSVFATAFGPGFEYGILTPIANFAERDGDSPIVKALGQDGARAFGQKSRRFLASQRVIVARVRTDLSYRPDPTAQLPVAVISNYSIVQGHSADFENYVKTEVTPAHKQMKTGGFVVYQTVFGGDGSSYVLATLLRNFAELDSGPAMTRAYGQVRTAAISKTLAGVVTHVERTVVHEMPELGFRVRATTEAR